MNPSLKRNLKKILPFGLIWAFYGFIYSLLEKGLLGDLNIYPSTGNPYNFTESLTITPLMSLAIGWLFGAAEVLLLNQLFNKRTFIQKIVLKTIIYTFAICAFLVALTLVTNATRLRLPPIDPEVIRTVVVFIDNFAFWSVILYSGSIMGITLFIHEVSDNLGLQVVKNFFTGKYHRPREENRIFMFLDMKSSTTIAEKLGHVTYFELLSQYYKDISQSIVRTSGEIYQYVGDEIIVSWTVKKGLRNNNCLRCFFLIKQTFQKRADHYTQAYGVVPGFKAGMHYGQVTTGEIGQIKKEIVFSGDVLNTTSRIQGLCNRHNADILISEDLLDILLSKEEFKFKKLGESELRGKDTTVNLYSLSEKQ